MVFLKNHAQNVVEKLLQDLFQNIKIEHISKSIFKKFHAVCFYFVSLNPGLPKYIKTTIMTTWFYVIQIFLKTNKKSSKTSLPISFFASFSKKNISYVIHSSFISIVFFRFSLSMLGFY